MQGQEKCHNSCRTTEMRFHENATSIKTPCSKPLQISSSVWCYLHKQRCCQTAQKTYSSRLYACQPVSPAERKDTFEYNCEVQSGLKSPIPAVLVKFLQNTTTLFHECPLKKYRLKAPLSTLPLNIERKKIPALKPDTSCYLHSCPKCKIHHQARITSNQRRAKCEDHPCQYINFPKQTSELNAKENPLKLINGFLSCPRTDMNTSVPPVMFCPYTKNKVLINSRNKEEESSCCSKCKTCRCQFKKQGNSNNSKNMDVESYEHRNEKVSDWPTTSENLDGINKKPNWEMDTINEEGKSENVTYVESPDVDGDLKEYAFDKTPELPFIETSEASTDQNAKVSSTRSNNNERCSCSLCEIDLYIKKLKALITTYDPFLSPYSPIKDKLQKRKLRKRRRLLSSEKYFETSRCACCYKEQSNEESRRIPFSETSLWQNSSKCYNGDRLTEILEEMEKWKGNYYRPKLKPCNCQCLCYSKNTCQ